MILIEHGALFTALDGRLGELASGYLAVEGDRIAALGAGDAPDEWRQRAGRVIDAQHVVVLPGLVNGHTHLSQTFLRGQADDRPLIRWLKEVIWPAQAADGSGPNNSQDLLECAKIGALLAKHVAVDAHAMVAADVIRMMTTDGARLWDRPHEPRPQGLTPGAPADITLVNLNTVRCQPVHRVAAAVAYNASGPDVHSVIVGGELLLDAGRVTMLDEAALLETCRDAAARLLKRAAISV